MSYHNNITFTKLTPDDIATHEELYTNELFDGNSSLPLDFVQMYHDYAIVELQKAVDLFHKTFK